MPQPILVTALLDIGRNKSHPQFRRRWSDYENSLKRLCQLDLPFRIYAETPLHAKILKWRQGKPTTVVAIDQEYLRQSTGLDQIQRIRQSERWLCQADWLRYSPMAELDTYIPLVNSKIKWLADAANEGDANDQLIWIDAGIHMHLYTGERGLVSEDFFRQFIRDPAKLRMLAKPYEKNTEVHGFERHALANYCGTDFVDRCCRGGIFGGGADIIKQMAHRFDEFLAETLNEGYLGTEECLLTVLSYRYPEQCDTTLIQQTHVAALFSARTPRLNTRHLRHPRPVVKTLKRRALTQWTRWRRNAQVNKIMQLPPITGLDKDNFDLHILLCAKDVINGLWTLRSFFHYSGLRPSLIIHDDSTLTDEDRQHLLQHFPEARIIGFQQAHDDMSRALSSHPAAFRYRITEYSWPAIKLLDFAHYSGGRPFMVLDADVLFFRQPIEMIQAMQEGKGFFMSDWQDAYTWPVDRWPAVLETEGIARVNVGLFYLPDGQLYDLDYVDQCLNAYYQRQPCPRSIWLEQTVWGALFARLGPTMQRLPDTYQISRQQPLTANTRSHHYVNDSRLSRLDFVNKGIPYLIQNDFLKQDSPNQPVTGAA
ncbi:MAG: WlaTC/HtrL family glycosyltransferase [Pseudomonadota bacterium]|nr:WlaTC/HtrL family glycosyltransferase [Pseudomonadota bacterium]